MGRTVDDDSLHDVPAVPDLPAATRDLMVEDQQLAGSRPDQELPPPDATGYQVVVGDIPSEPPGFWPRAGLLAELDRSSTRVSVLHAVRGLHGLGATQVAAAYARLKVAAGWRLVAWVNGADPGNLHAGLAAVADAAGLTDVGSGGSVDPGAAVRRWLETDGDRCLLVFDDVSDPELLRPFVPAGGTARVLITTNRQSAADLGSIVPVDVLSASEASAFLAGRTGLHDEAEAAAVAAELGYLPLALALAAPVISGQRHGYARYLDELQATPTDLSLTADHGRPYPQSVARAVLLSMAAVRASDKTGMCARMMAILAVLPAAAVRRELLYVVGRAGALTSGGRRVEAAVVDQVLDWLSDRSLLTSSLDGQTVTMHRLIARVIRHGLARRRRLGAVCWVAASMAEAYAIAQAGSQDRPAVRRIQQLVTALLENTAELAGEADEELAGILLRLRFLSLYHLTELGDSAPQAVATGELLTADLERLLGPGHPDTLNARNSLAAAYLAANRVADAISVFEQTLAVFQRQLGSDHPDALTSQNNLASAYQDAGRIAEAVQLHELTLAERERVLGADHPSTLTSQGNLAAAYLAAGRIAEAIPLLQQTMAGRGRVLGANHPDTQITRKNLAQAYQDAGRGAEAIPLLEEISAGRRRVLPPSGWAARTIPPVEPTPADRASHAPPADFRRPPADPARPALPASFRRPPVDQAGRLPAEGVAASRVRLPDRSFSRPAQKTPVSDAEHDRVAGAAITAGDPAGLAMAYDRHAAALYGYCYWMLGDAAAAAGSLQDTFVVAAATRADRSGPGQLRPWLFALARSQCQRRVRPGSAIRDEADVESRPAAGGQRVAEVSRPAGAADVLADVTSSFPVVSEPPEAIDDLADATMLFPAAFSSADATMRFEMASAPLQAIRPLADATMQIAVGGPLADATMQFRMFGESADAADPLADVSGYVGQAELHGLIRSVLADMKPREREVIELGFRHDLTDDDLAVVLGASPKRTHALAARTRGRLEKSFGTLRAALVGRQACPVVAELLADWDGQLSEQTRDLVAWHMEQCPTCRNNTQGALRPTVLSGLLPLAPLPPELREQVLSRCSSAAEEAVVYRRRVVRRAESRWAVLFSRAVKRVSWRSIRANPGAAVATTAVAVWAAAAASVLLITFAGSHAARAQAVQPTASTGTHVPAADSSTGIPTTSPTIVSSTPSARRSAAPTRSAVITQPSTYVSIPVRPSPSPEVSRSPSPKPSKSASAKPSGSPSTSPSRSPSASPSSSPSPTA
ncbi:MAG TPA: tetratricopeptide repeat protein [Streptosporangiaceae bacterium]|nr:tetratricopeptide repeat protein [Streptosporangiaceae bacterium]